jgi:hypothetical protein
MDLGIVIVSYNTRELTANCLTSVYDSLGTSDLQARVWVVDNASADDSAEMIRQRFPQVKLVASQENLGFAAGTNLGIEHMAQADAPPRYVLLLNPDTLVASDAIPRMVAHLDGNPQVGVVGAQLRYEDGSFQHGAFHFPTLLMAFFDFWPIHHRLTDSPLNGRYPRRLYQAGKPFAIDHPLGAALMIRWQTLAQVGLLNTGYFMYCEEIDWCMRIQEAGWGIYCVPQAHITHLAGQSTRQFREKMFVALWKSRYRLFGRYYGRLYNVVVRWIVRAGLRRDLRRVRAAQACGELDAATASHRIQAYRAVMEM